MLFYCGTAPLVLPEIIKESDNCAVPPPAVVTSCLKGVQSLVSSSSYKQGAFFTEGTMEKVRDSIACSRQFMSSSAFDPWDVTHLLIVLSSSLVTLLLVISFWRARMKRLRKGYMEPTVRHVLYVLLLPVIHLRLDRELCQGL